MIVTNGLLTKDEFKDIRGFCVNLHLTYGWTSNKEIGFGHWNHDIINAPLRTDLDLLNKLPRKLRPFWKKLKHEVLVPEAILSRCYVSAATFGTEGYIHVDDEEPDTVTSILYLNEKWTAHWGGETVFYAADLNQIIGSCLPAPGRVVTFRGNIPHRAAPVSRICPELRLVLVVKALMKQPKTSEELTKLGNFLESIGADRLPHAKGTLRDHLLRCYSLLKSVRAPDHVCMAAGLHSIYATNQMGIALMTEDERAFIMAEFGVEAENLAWAFGHMNRPMDLEAPATNVEHLDELRMIECANLYDQGELRNWPTLNEFAKQKLAEITPKKV